MISDALFDAANRINYYLSEPVFADVYQGDMRDRIESLVKEMNSIQNILDNPFSTDNSSSTGESTNEPDEN